MNLTAGSAFVKPVPTNSEREPELPPSTDRGVTPTTGEAGCILPDWLDYTGPDDVPLSVLLPGADKLQWEDLERGRYGYKRGIAAGPIQVYHDGQPGMGTFVHLSGQGCRALEEAGVLGDDPVAGWTDLYRHLLDSDFHITRADFAIDDRSGQLDMAEIGAAVENGTYTSKWHGGKVERQFDKDGLKDNQTITWGSAQSNSRLRIYDKAAERREAGEDVGELPWIRVELQLRDEQATAMVRRIVETDAAGAAVAGVIRGHLEFKEAAAGDSNKSRWAPVEWWLAFLDHAAKLRLGIGRPRRTMERIQAWLVGSVARSLAMYRMFRGGNDDYITALIEGGERRLKPRDLEVVQAGIRQRRLTAAAA